MRPLRLLLSLSTSLFALIIVLYMVMGASRDEQHERVSAASHQGGFKALFSFASPGSLFPPSAIISLTDDNSTFFLARPAAFGPSLPNDGLSGALWVGNGFYDDNMGAGGELGCSDVPGWEEGSDDLVGALQPTGSVKSSSMGTPLGKDLAPKEGLPKARDDLPEHGAVDDGTDDHLQPASSRARTQSRGTHADIQSLQESAEISGKVVLLKRGGCGFLAKVQWAQSRGGKAVIVGDDVRGGALVRMYAKGDTSNITIPSLFTSHTTAHLLSSLLPDQGMLASRVHATTSSNQDDKPKVQKPAGQSDDVQNPQTPSHDATTSPKASVQGADSDTSKTSHPGWVHSLLSSLRFAASDDGPRAGSRRLPNSGDLEWVEVGDWDDDEKPIRTRSLAATAAPTSTSDGFVIGEQDWRDPDLLPLSTSTSRAQTLSSPTPVLAAAGGNALPGSGEYSSSRSIDDEAHPWWKWRSGSKKPMSTPSAAQHGHPKYPISATDAKLGEIKGPHLAVQNKELWVTLTPTNVSSSPFFDTLLVLVVSPLVTLTVVYILLLFRSRIRRRRWRAPKSVVERLPVRTYQTMSESSSAATLAATSPTTPLLQHIPSRPRSSGSRSRSSTESEISGASASPQPESSDREEEKRESGLAAWRRRYGGRQKECVVCLEDYVDGVSRVMSLPCGHEFHADCITPWLVTRRRTCPICKGDVVRSLSWRHDRLQSASPTRSPRIPTGDEDVQTQAAETRNTSPSASRPVPTSRSSNNHPIGDVEAGLAEEDSRLSPGTSLRELASSVSTVVWRGVDAVRSTTGLQRRSPEDFDRNR
ncbi:pa and ring finger domain-containing protein [Stemphylium lycopersici]|uniref:RING-type E3 ubiquitin transferase n=1 Tax=Stemphylium lycopersici TaxID=183478 RepID=A0A364MY80_STELY|nr:pa and ring finger domain-containing protein [Stemphylium lycopersici]RAR06815.1 pa and ring finger domain-containing protein [Stemphylium lycopersici]